MKTLRTSLRKGFTLIELLVVISIIAIIASLAMPAFSSFLLRTNMTKQMSDGLNIWKAMGNYATNPDDDSFPAYTDREDPATAVNDSNSAFEILLSKGLLDDKKVFFNSKSAWCQKQAQGADSAKKVLTGENDWAYVTGLRRSTADSKWPMLANAFTPGSTSYVTDTSKKGGVWKGNRAVVIYAGGNGDVPETLDQGGRFIVRRADKPQQDAFQKDGEWLGGDKVQILMPK